MPWQTQPVVSPGVDALTSKILCRRHNSALSPLDAHAVRAFLAFEAAQGHAVNRSLTRRRHAAILSGQALELWALKTLAGYHATGMEFTFGPHRLRDYPPPMDRIAAALTSGDPSGLVRLEVSTDPDTHEATLGRSAVSTLPIVDAERNRLAAILFRMQGVGLMFHLADEAGRFDDEPGSRPHMVDFIGPDRSSRIYLGWPEAAPGRVVTIKMRPASPRAVAAWAAARASPT